jgi:hypothetical protein
MPSAGSAKPDPHSFCGSAFCHATSLFFSLWKEDINSGLRYIYNSHTVYAAYCHAQWIFAQPDAV